MNLLFNNTKEKGFMTRIVFKENEYFVGVCLEFDLEIEGKSLEETEEKLSDYSRAWLYNVQKNNLSDELLNRPAPKKYWEVYLRIVKAQKELAERKIKQSKTNPSILQVKPFSTVMQSYNIEDHKFSSVAS